MRKLCTTADAGNALLRRQKARRWRRSGKETRLWHVHVLAVTQFMQVAAPLPLLR